jgi:hypothetical protein
MCSWLMAVDCVGRYAGRASYILKSTRNHENKGKTNNCGYSVHAVPLMYAELGECFTQCVLYSVSTLDHGMER